MCKLNQPAPEQAAPQMAPPDQSRSPVPNNSPFVPLQSSNAPQAPDDASAEMYIPPTAAPPATSTQPTTKKVPTKLGSFLQFMVPLAGQLFQGGVDGAGAQGGFFGGMQQAQGKQMERMKFGSDMQYRRSQINAENALADYHRNMPYFRTGATVKGTDENGNDILLQRDPHTGQYEPIPGMTPYEKAPTPAKKQMKEINGGLNNYNPDSGTLSPIEDPNAGPPAPPPLISGDRQLKDAKYTAPKPTTTSERDSKGVSRPIILDNNPQSPTFGQVIAQPNVSQQPLPRRPSNSSANPALKKQQLSDAENSANFALQQNGGDPDKAIKWIERAASNPKYGVDASQLPQIRKSITDIAKPRNPKKKTYATHSNPISVQ